MAPKKKPESRLGRFKQWSGSHQGRVLSDAGITPEDFAKLSTPERRQVLDRGIAQGRALAQPYGASPLTGRQALADATQMAGLAYGPAIRSAQGVENSAPGWYQGFIDRSIAANTAQQQQAQPLLDTAQAAVTNAGATAPGLDPNSPQYAKEVQAAAGRQTMAQDSANYLAGIPAATTGYLAGQQSIAARELPQTQAYLAAQTAGLRTDQGNKVTELLSALRTGEQNNSIARSTLGLNVANSATDAANAAANIDIARGVDPVTGKPLPTDAPTGYAPGSPGLNSYGYSADEWAALSDDEKKKARAGKGKSGSSGETPAQRRAAGERENKRVAGIREKSGAVLSKVDDAIGAWQNYAKRKVETGTVIETQDKDGNTVKTPEYRDATPSDVRQQMMDAGWDAGMVHVALLRRAKPPKPLDKEAVDYLHRKGVRVPRDWLPQRSKVGAVKAPDGHGGSRPT